MSSPSILALAALAAGKTDNRSEAERRLHQHVTMFGSAGYPIRKVGRSWHWEDSFGVPGAPTVYKTKREAVAAFERFLDILCDKAAGRL